MAQRQAAEARPRPEGRRPPGPSRPDRRCACGSRPRPKWSGCAKSCRPRNIPVSKIDAREPDAVPRRRDPAGAGRANSVRPPPKCRRTSIAAPPATGIHTLHDAAEHPGDAARRSGRAGAADDRAARERARRHRAEHRAAGRRRRSDSGPAPRRHRRRAGEADHGIAGPARAEDRRAGPRVHQGGAAGQRSGAAGHARSCPASAAPPATPAPSTTWSKK